MLFRKDELTTQSAVREFHAAIPGSQVFVRDNICNYHTVEKAAPGRATFEIQPQTITDSGGGWRSEDKSPRR